MKYILMGRVVARQPMRHKTGLEQSLRDGIDLCLDELRRQPEVSVALQPDDRTMASHWTLPQPESPALMLGYLDDHVSREPMLTASLMQALATIKSPNIAANRIMRRAHSYVAEIPGTAHELIIPAYRNVLTAAPG